MDMTILELIEAIRNMHPVRFIPPLPWTCDHEGPKHYVITASGPRLVGRSLKRRAIFEGGMLVIWPSVLSFQCVVSFVIAYSFQLSRLLAKIVCFSPN